MISSWDSQNPVHHGINYLLVQDFSHQRMKFQEKMETVRFKQPQSGRHVGCHHGHGIRCVGSDSCWLTRLGKRTSHPIPGQKRKMSAFQKSTPQKKKWQRVEASVYHGMVKKGCHLMDFIFVHHVLRQPLTQRWCSSNAWTNPGPEDLTATCVMQTADESLCFPTSRNLFWIL